MSAQSRWCASHLSLLLTADPELTGISLAEKPSHTALPGSEHRGLQGAQHAVLSLAYFPSVLSMGQKSFRDPELE